jgi:PAS domain S-box-containing protein
MDTVFLITDAKEHQKALSRALPEDCSVVVLDSSSELSGSISLNPCLAVIDLTSSMKHRLMLMEEIHRILPSCSLVTLLPEQYRDEEDLFAESVYETLYSPLKVPVLRRIVKHALERGRLLGELDYFKRLLRSDGDRRETQQKPAAGGVGFMLSRALKGFAKGPGAGFDINSLAEFVHESINEFSSVTRVSLVFGTPEKGYRIHSSRRLNPDMADSIALSADRGLLFWLCNQGRILRRSEANLFSDESLHQAVREMDMLQAVVSIPIIGQGRLLGAVNLGEKAVGGTYDNEELEMLYVLASNVAIALENIQIFRELRHQKSYIEYILQRMNSGVITIDDRDTITIFNQRAADILGLSRDVILGCDLRALPSPLGDIIHQSLAGHGRFEKHEVQIVGPRTCKAEISTFQLQDDGEGPPGAVLIFDDISAERDLQREKEQRQHLELLNRVLATIAHELRNPLVSVNTFIDLFPMKKFDDEFSSSFYDTVCTDIRRLEDLLSKLIVLSQATDYSFRRQDLSAIIDNSLQKARKCAAEADVLLESHIGSDPVEINADDRELGRAFGYILRNSIEASPSGSTVRISAELKEDADLVRITIVDQGEPLPESGPDYILQLFYQGEGRGGDIGLAVAQRIVEDHGGVMSITSESSRTGMVLLLPVWRGEDA